MQQFELDYDYVKQLNADKLRQHSERANWDVPHIRYKPSSLIRSRFKISLIRL